MAAGWWEGEPVGEARGERQLARRLLDVGLAHPEPPPGDRPDAVTVVIPVHDHAKQLRRCLAALDPRLRVIVVDDGSPDPSSAQWAIAERPATRCVRLTEPHGPGAARNAGLSLATTPFVAFIDADCVVPSGFPGRLLDHLADPGVAVVAPRIVALDQRARGCVARFEALLSSLDMGERSGPVGPGRSVPYVPSAAMLVRVSAFGDGFDDALRWGEDVDLIWRLVGAGWRVRYDTSVAVAHAHRVHPPAWFGRRVAYDSACAPLARRHRGSLPAATLTRRGAAFWFAVMRGDLLRALCHLVDEDLAVSGRLAAHGDLGSGFAVEVVVRARLREGRQLGRALRGPWLPAAISLAWLDRRFRRRLEFWVALSLLADWTAEGRSLPPLAYAGPRLAADLARGLGVWRGCLRQPAASPLLPHIRG